MKNKIKFPQIYFDIIKIFIINFFIFELLRLFFVIRYHELFSFSFFKDTLKAFWLGPKFDFSISAYIFLLFIFVDLFFFLKKKIINYRKKYIYAIAVFFLPVFFLHLVDLEFYAEYNSHLNYTAIEYLDTADMILFMIFKEYPVFRYLLIFVALSFLYFFLIKKFIINKKLKENYILSKFIYLPIMIFFFIFCVRGGLSVSILNWGDAFFSSHNIVNQATLNPVFNLLKDIYYVNKTKKNYSSKNNAYFKDDKEAVQYLQKLIISPKDSLLDEKYPFYRETKRSGIEKKYNVVILLMEEFSAEFVGCFGNELNLTPNFDKLAKEGILFDNFYSGGQRTNKGISCVMCSYPPLAGSSIMKRPNGQQKITTIASILKEKGYNTYFFYGGDASYDNMQGFLVPKGIDKVFDLSDFETKDKLNKWGVSDGKVFDKLIEEFDKNNDAPFFALMMSLTNHPPYNVPDDVDYGGKVETGKELDGNYNTFKYVDYEMGKFFEKIKNKPYFKNTIFVILGDHSKTLHHDFNFDYRKSFVPCLYYAPYILSPQKISKIYGQIDVAPTIFYLLNMSIKHSFFGKNMFGENQDNFAYIVRNSNFAYVNKDFFFSGSFEQKENFLYKYKDFSTIDYKKEYPKKTENLFKKVSTLQQVSLYLFETKIVSK